MLLKNILIPRNNNPPIILRQLLRLSEFHPYIEEFKIVLTITYIILLPSSSSYLRLSSKILSISTMDGCSNRVGGA
jgi:hypothetical protein